MKTFRYYFFLIQSKISMRIHNTLEKKVKCDNLISVEDFQFFLLKIIISNLIKTDSGIYFNTRIKNINKPMTLAQARVLLSFCKLYDNNQISFRYKYIIENLKEFILSLQENSGIYKFNHKKWNLQDEGIATIWSLLSLLQAYKILKDEKLLGRILNTVNIMHNKLIDKNNSLIHTLGDNFWCLNAASTYAFFVNQILPYYYTEELVFNYKKAIELCVQKLTPEGYFPYSKKRTGTYLLLYNPVVIYTLENAINNDIIDKELEAQTINALERARLYLLKQMDENKFFVEPEQKRFSRYIISNITSLVVLKNKISKELESQILNNITSFLINDKLYLCRNRSGQYFNGNLYEVNDVLITEVFYWLLTYLYN